jgi:probable F420-dependent oxidoreductase
VKPFRFGVQAGLLSSPTEWRERAQRIEAWGYASLVVADHLTDTVAPLLSLLAAAHATTRLTLGTLVLNNDFRHPVLLAREIASLAAFAPGRVELGLGAGHAVAEYRRAGLVFDAPGVRISRLAESVHLLRRLLDGETVDFAGQFYRLDGERTYPTPTGRVPILLGGGRRILEIAARHADIVGFTGFGPPAADGSRRPTNYAPAAIDEQVAWVRDNAGARFARLELHIPVQHVELTDHPDQTAERLVQSTGLSRAVVSATPFMLFGPIEALIDQLVATRARWGHSYFTIPWAAAAAFAPVVGRLSNT